MLLHEIQSPIDPKEREDVIRGSFDDSVVSDLVAGEAHTGEVVDAREVIRNIQQKFPELKDVNLKINPDADRVRIYFSSDGRGGRIEVPPKLRTGLGEVLVLHEIAHLLYTKDILTNKIIKHRAGAQAFTILRVLEDVAIEKRLEEEYPNAVDIFKSRAQHIMPVYKESKPSKFASEIDQLFLYLRGYMKTYKGDPYVHRYAMQYLETDDAETKIDAVLNIVDRMK